MGYPPDSLQTARRCETRAFDWPALGASAEVSRFTGAGGVEECHLTVRPTRYGPVERQLEVIQEAYESALAACGLSPQTAVLRRFFGSDLPNQAAALEARPFANPRTAAEPCAVSWAGQPPAPPAKLALWAYHVNDPAGPLDKTHDGTTLSLRRGELGHHWTTSLTCAAAESSYDQTRAIFDAYEGFLRTHDLTLADHVVRTWLFVQNVDANYKGLVAARRELFAARGLTQETHYIASTGIEGGLADVAAKVGMDAYAIAGLRPEQLEFIAAPEHLSPTHIYGVTFERATSVAYRDRKHVFISGTASINRRGEIVHPGDVSRQLDRTLENVEALLAQAGAELEDMGVFIVYVRDPADQALIAERMRERVGNAPMQVVTAPVCRPGWLVEVEGIAAVAADRPSLPAW